MLKSKELTHMGMETGTISLPGGDRYEGLLLDGAFHGFGTMTYANGDRYEGEWKAGRQHGRGKITYERGGTFSGVFREGSIWSGSGGRFSVCSVIARASTPANIIATNIVRKGRAFARFIADIPINPRPAIMLAENQDK